MKQYFDFVFRPIEDLDRYKKSVCYQSLAVGILTYLYLAVYYTATNQMVYGIYNGLMLFLICVCMMLAILLEYSILHKMIYIFLFALSILHAPMVYSYLKQNKEIIFMWYLMYPLIFATFYKRKAAFFSIIYVLILTLAITLLAFVTVLPRWIVVDDSNDMSVFIVKAVAFALLFGIYLISLIKIYDYRIKKAEMRTENQMETEQLQCEILELNAILVRKNELISKLTGEGIKDDSLSFAIKKDTKKENEFVGNSNFNNQYPDFFVKLQEMAAPYELSNLEQKYCMLLFLGYSNQDIAGTLFVAANTVKSQKQRIKKKLKLSPDDNLDKFVKKLL
ncbi:MAG: LuxR C-terminal-related transcriptional regulator [Prevotellaceae bacterium]|jgi:DNA-binding CsgD family transcriptional regulator|nr:LuxR C-terminal-related transcriptional regulator [Prevotellaceae bacterium]